MDQNPRSPVSLHDADAGVAGRPEAAGATRRQVLKCGVCGLACLAAGGAGAYYLARRSGAMAAAALSTDVFHNDAPSGPLWERWQQRGWAQEARHYTARG